MLTDYEKALICDALDRRLTEQQRAELRALLADSKEARALYMKMRADRRRVRRLPRELAPANMVSDVMRQIAQHRIIELPKPAQRSNQRLGAWLTIAAAVVVLIGLSIVSLELGGFSTLSSRNKSVANLPRPEATPPAVSTPKEQAQPTPPPSEPDAPVANVTPSPSPADQLPTVPDSNQLPRMSGGESPEVLAAPYDSMLRLFKVEMPKLPPILPARELNRPERRSELLEAIKGQAAIHVDVFCRDTNPALDRLTRLLEQQGKLVIVDLVAKLRHQAKLKTDYMLIAEWRSPQELTEFFASIAARENGKNGDLFDSVVPMPMSPVNLRTLAALLGVDVKTFSPKTAAVDPKQSLSDSTIQELARALEKNGSDGRADSRVLAISFNPVRPNPAQSREIREFLSTRKEPTVGSILTVLLLRNMN
ncbi:MAG: hypothetical protein N2039_15550 [Gemmataceae bacterium]|nr:hypothetical protein [Gemmataceae bacterium]